ncbi:hypothetical protein M153_594000357 [Pseudoloma neurophilia]|uniref:Uncharacterized protein n=1 Tax=Pseudoloma neurophilia TaxID=146866 RepID=A0A0R0LWM6_9MICR|nr:hypothetical protein M153_594000357 [Pseudoloma neurophilia]
MNLFLPPELCKKLLNVKKLLLSSISENDISIQDLESEILKNFKSTSTILPSDVLFLTLLLINGAISEKFIKNLIEKILSFVQTSGELDEMRMFIEEERCLSVEIFKSDENKETKEVINVKYFPITFEKSCHFNLLDLIRLMKVLFIKNRENTLLELRNILDVCTMKYFCKKVFLSLRVDLLRFYQILGQSKHSNDQVKVRYKPSKNENSVLEHPIKRLRKNKNKKKRKKNKKM